MRSLVVSLIGLDRGRRLTLGGGPTVILLQRPGPSTRCPCSASSRRLSVVLVSVDVVLSSLHETLVEMSTHTHEYLSEYAQKFVAQGEARGKAGAVLAVLDARGIAVPNAARTRIGACDDPHQLDVWVRRAAIADSVEDLFGEPRTAQH